MSSTDLDLSPSATVPDRKQYPLIKQFVGLLDKPQVMNMALVIVLVIAALFRFHGSNWDEGHHLYPDERFLSTMTNNLQWPKNFANYFDPSTSTLSPYSLPNMGLYVYGTLPVYVVKWTAFLLDKNNYDKITLVGRYLSALFDIVTIFFLFLIAKRLYDKKVGLLARTWHTHDPRSQYTPLSLGITRFDLYRSANCHWLGLASETTALNPARANH
jgi:hypothetical protein